MSVLQYLFFFFREDIVVFPAAMAKLNMNKLTC